MPIDYKDYPPDWKEIVARIKERENHCCKFCKIENYSTKVSERTNKLYKIVLTVAHLDHDETNWDVKDERLAALCQSCHLKYDAPEKSRRRNEKKEALKNINQPGFNL